MVRDCMAAKERLLISHLKLRIEKGKREEFSYKNSPGIRSTVPTSYRLYHSCPTES